jgi:hypothetical protein
MFLSPRNAKLRTQMSPSVEPAAICGMETAAIGDWVEL